MHREQILVSPRGFTHVGFDGNNFTFCGHEFPLQKKGWRMLREDEKVRVTCKVCQRGKAGY